jgi:hypothetical protein
MVALDAVARPEEDRLRTSSYRRSPRGTTLCPVLALSRLLYRPLTLPQKTTPQQRLQEAARGDEAVVRKVHRRPTWCWVVTDHEATVYPGSDAVVVTAAEHTQAAERASARAGRVGT